MNEEEYILYWRHVHNRGIIDLQTYARKLRLVQQYKEADYASISEWRKNSNFYSFATGEAAQV